MISPNCLKGEEGTTKGYHEICESEETCSCFCHSEALQYAYPVKKYMREKGRTVLLAGDSYRTPEGWFVIYASNVLADTAEERNTYTNWVYESGRDSVEDGWDLD